MIVTNRQRVTAIVVKRDKQGLRLVPMSSGKLHVVKLTDDEFKTEWSQIDYDLDKALDSFLTHAHRVGATREALQWLHDLKDRQQHQLAFAL